MSKPKLLSIEDLRKKKPAELQQYVIDLQKNKVELLHALTTNKEKRSHQLGLIRRSIARAKTVLAQQTKEEEK